MFNKTSQPEAESTEIEQIDWGPSEPNQLNRSALVSRKGIRESPDVMNSHEVMKSLPCISTVGWCNRVREVRCGRAVGARKIDRWYRRELAIW